MMTCLFPMMSACGTRGTIARCMPGYKNRKFQKWTGWRPRTDEQKIEFEKKVTEEGEDKNDDDLVTIWKTIEIATSKVAHRTEDEKENILCMLENVRLRDKAAAR